MTTLAYLHMLVYERYMSLYRLCIPVTSHLLLVLVLDKRSLIMHTCQLPFVIILVLDKGLFDMHNLLDVRDIISHMLHVTHIHMS